MLVNTPGLKTVLNAIKEYIRKQINKIKRPDWNQNDESAQNYIKNRTHWKEEGSKRYERVPLRTYYYGNAALRYVGDRYFATGPDSLFQEYPFAILAIPGDNYYSQIHLSSLNYEFLNLIDASGQIVAKRDLTQAKENKNSDGKLLSYDILLHGDDRIPLNFDMREFTVVLETKPIYHKIPQEYLPDDAREIVLYSKQTLTDDQQEQARTNIGSAKEAVVLVEPTPQQIYEAVRDENTVYCYEYKHNGSYIPENMIVMYPYFTDFVGSGYIRYKGLAIGGSDGLVYRYEVEAGMDGFSVNFYPITEPVSYGAQSLSVEQQAQARQNIGALDVNIETTPVDTNRTFFGVGKNIVYVKNGWLKPCPADADKELANNYANAILGFGFINTNISVVKGEAKSAFSLYQQGLISDKGTILKNPLDVAQYITWTVGTTNNKTYIDYRHVEHNGFYEYCRYFEDDTYSYPRASYSLSNDMSDSEPRGSVAQYAMSANPTKDMHIATKQYVDSAKTEAQQLGLMSVAPGQFIIVKSVDENGAPTEWEALPGTVSRNDICPGHVGYALQICQVEEHELGLRFEAVPRMMDLIGLDIQNAKVGEIVRVKYIDDWGCPTGYETAPLPPADKWEKIKEIVIAEDAEESNALTINTDEDGNAFRLKKARLCAKFPAYTGESEIPNYSFTMINGKNTGSQAPLLYTSVWPKISTSDITGMVYEVDVSGPQQIETVQLCGNVTWANDSGKDYAVYGSTSDTQKRLIGSPGWAYPITSIGGTSMLIYPGCRFELYGVRAEEEETDSE